MTRLFLVVTLRGRRALFDQRSVHFSSLGDEDDKVRRGWEQGGRVHEVPCGRQAKTTTDANLDGSSRATAANMGQESRVPRYLQRLSKVARAELSTQSQTNPSRS